MNTLRPPTRRLDGKPRIVLKTDALERWMNLYAATICSSEAHLTDLDRAIGDGDHGTNMRRGMDAVVRKMKGEAPSDLCGFLRWISMTLTSSVGGASGPLYGAFFLQGSHAALHKTELTLNDVALLVDAGYRGVMQLGKASPGDKTMVDTLGAAVLSLRSSCSHRTLLPEALATCERAAMHAAEATIPMVAHKGRASYLGDRSAGFEDPGAASASLLFESLAQAVTVPLLALSSTHISQAALL